MKCQEKNYFEKCISKKVRIINLIHNLYYDNIIKFSMTTLTSLAIKILLY